MRFKKIEYNVYIDGNFTNSDDKNNQINYML
jgi:hypothetical protein